MKNADVEISVSLKKVFAIVALWSIAIAKPLLDVIGDSPEYWTANRFNNSVIIFITLVISILLPALISGFLFYLLRSKRTINIGIIAFDMIFIVLFAIAIYYTASFFIGKPLFLVCASIGLSLLALYLFNRHDAARLFLAIFSTMSVVVPVSFLMFGPTSNLILTSGESKNKIEALAELDAPLVIVVFDELSLASLLDENGEIDAKLFPNFSHLENMSTWYLNATTNYGNTERSVPSFLTGKLQSGEVAGTSYSQNPNNLFTLVHAPDGVIDVESVTNLCPPDICSSKSKGFLDELNQIFYDFLLIYKNIMIPDRYASRITPIPKRFQNLASIKNHYLNGNMEVNDSVDIGGKLSNWFRAGNHRTLVFLHIGLPHAPYIMNPDGTRYVAGADYGMIGWNPKEHAWYEDAQFYTAQAFQRYLLQTMYVDKFLGEILSSLVKSGVFDESTIVITADHGVAFTTGRKRRSNKLDQSVKGEINSIPFFWKSPGQKIGAKNMKNIELIDFLPSLIEQLNGSDKLSEMDGNSIFSSKEKTEKIYDGSTYKNNYLIDVINARERLYKMINVVNNDDGTFFPQPSKYSDLINVEIGNLTTTKDIVEIDHDVNSYGCVEKDNNVTIVPNFVQGWLKTEGRVDALGLAINGVIVDVAELFVDDLNRHGFNILFNPKLIRQEKCRIDFVSVKYDSSGDPVLYLLNTTGNEFYVENNKVKDSSGNTLKKNQAKLIGAIDYFDFRIPGVLQISGWMGDEINWKPPIAYIVLYRGEQKLYRTSVLRKDLSSLSDDMTRSGFSTGLRLRGHDFDLNQVKIFVIFDNKSYAEMKMKEGLQ